MSADDPRDDDFKVETAPKAGLLKRLIGRIPREAAFVEIRNLLATTPYESMTREMVAGILRRAGLDHAKAVDDLSAIYEQATLRRTADGELSNSDLRGIAALQVAFGLDDPRAAVAREHAVAKVFERRIREALADGILSPEERTTLESTAAALGLGVERRDALYADAAKRAIQTAVDSAIADCRYAPTEEERVKALAASLDVTLTYEESTAAILERFRTLARIDAGELPEQEVSIRLQRGETCHFFVYAVDHKEMRVVTKRVNYSGPTASVRIMKGVRWRVGSVCVERVTQDVLTPIDTVDFFITSKRVLLQGNRKNTAVPLSKIVDFTVFSDGLQVHKETGKDVYVVGASHDWEMAGACLDAALGRHSD